MIADCILTAYLEFHLKKYIYKQNRRNKSGINQVYEETEG